MRVTRPKTRMPWSRERIQALLTSPIYAGYASPHRRWKPGACIIRDATYWVPLMIMTMGTRIEEVLGLKRRNVIRRNGVHCLVLGMDPDQRVKTSDRVQGADRGPGPRGTGGRGAVSPDHGGGCDHSPARASPIGAALPQPPGSSPARRPLTARSAAARSSTQSRRLQYSSRRRRASSSRPPRGV